MTSLATNITGTTAPAERTQTGRMIVIAAAAASLGVSAMYAHAHPGAVTDPALARLLRAMAAIKMLLAACAGAAVWWRLGVPARAGWLAGYAAAASALAAGPVLIWSLTHIGLGALLLHGGLLANILLLWRDPVTGARLEQAITARRARFRI
jgi:hypothetical protein